jgi:two-component system, OmpR family, response regulator
MKPSVLIIDTLAEQQSIVHILEERFICYTAQSLTEAQSFIGRIHPAVILLELNQPDGDGMEFLPYLRQHVDGAIACLTWRSATNDKVQAFHLGADDYLIKPANLNTLPTRLTLLQRLAQRRGYIAS